MRIDPNSFIKKPVADAKGKPFKDTLRDTLQLLKSTFTVIKTNPDILKPTVAQIVVGIIIAILFAAFIVGFIMPDERVRVISTFAIILFPIILLVLLPFIFTYYRAAQCWIVYKTFAGKDVTYKEGIRRARQNAWDIVAIGALSILFSLAAGAVRGKGRQGGLGVLIKIALHAFARVIEEIWDLLGNYLLPAAIIPEKHVGEAFADIKHMKNNIPAALVGVFGIDFVTSIVLGPLIFLMFFAAIAIGILCAVLFNNPYIIGVLLFLALIAAVVLSVGTSMLKTIYFTLFYLSVAMPESISKEYRRDVTNYLLHKKVHEKV